MALSLNKSKSITVTASKAVASILSVCVVTAAVCIAVSWAFTSSADREYERINTGSVEKSKSIMIINLETWYWRWTHSADPPVCDHQFSQVNRSGDGSLTVATINSLILATDPAGNDIALHGVAVMSHDRASGTTLHTVSIGDVTVSAGGVTQRSYAEWSTTTDP